MRVNQQGQINTTESRTGRSESTNGVRTSGKAGRSGQASKSSDAIQLSNLASNLLTLAGMEAPGHTQRIEQLSMDVQTGRYQPDAMLVSRAIISAAFQPAA